MANTDLSNMGGKSASSLAENIWNGQCRFGDISASNRLARNPRV